MGELGFTGLLIAALLFPVSGFTQDQDKMKLETEILKVYPVAKNVLVHESYLETNDYGKVACNGAVFISGKEAVIFDTPAGLESSEFLINWLSDNLLLSIKAIVPTHHHVDCVAGLEKFHEEKIPSLANELTNQLARSKRHPLAQTIFNQDTVLSVGQAEVVVMFPGPGHTKDNVVAYFPTSKALFGGCLVKSINASKGNVADASLEQWSTTINRAKKRFPETEWVIPGHGTPGGIELLNYTIELFDEFAK